MMIGSEGRRVAVRTLVPVAALMLASCDAGPGSTLVQPQEVDDGVKFRRDLVDYYEPRSMLFQAGLYSEEVAGSPEQWSGPYQEPLTEEFRAEASEFLTIYPRSIVPAPGESVLGTLADEELWDALSSVGIELMHPTAFLQAGSVEGREFRPSIDGGFDRISLDVDPLFGDEDDARRLVEVATSHGALIAGDVIPLHTGLGPDFRLATMNYEDYPGIYDMIEIPEEDWGLLPQVDGEWGYTVIEREDAQPLLDEGYIPGVFDVLLEDPASTSWSGWAATGEVQGVDGVTRRWIYAHLFKAQQPTLNWMDPTYAGRRMMAGDVVRHVYDLGVRVDRLDAVPFLSIEPQEDSDEATVYPTPLAIAGTNDLAYLHRKLGGYTWVELNVAMEDYKDFMENGADLGYDFFTRAQTVFPLIEGDARVLRIAHQALLDNDIDHRTLIHDLQNHDEITFQLINLGAMEEVTYGDETLSGAELQERILTTMRENVAGEAAPYNRLYRPAENGVATTYAAYVAAALDIDPYEASEEEVDRIRQGHLLLAVVNAMQPGVFAISQWDLVGALPVDVEEVEEQMTPGDFRWINRGAVDLMGRAPDATESTFGLPVAQNLYGSLPDQLGDPGSFVSRIRNLIQARKRYEIAEAEVISVPDTGNDGVFALVMALPGSVGGIAVTLANYGTSEATVTLDLSGDAMVSGTPRDIIADEEVGELSGTELTVSIDPLGGRTIVIGASARPGVGGS